MPFEDKEGCLNINVHEPRNAEFTAFLGSFFVRQSLKKPPAMQVDNNRFSLQ